MLCCALLCCLVVDVFFSVLSPGTHIEPHCGATNLRLRCHLPLQLPTAGRAEMRVGNEWRQWPAQPECVRYLHCNAFARIAHAGSSD